jgi:penicillin amidase
MTTHRTALRSLLLPLILLACGSLAMMPAAAEQPPSQAPGSAPRGTQTLSVPGLRQPVRMLRDHWGIAHIYAANEHDLFFAQGYNVASDRLFQLELWRREATGTVAEILGPSELNRDIGNRLFTYRGDLTQELNWYHPHGAAIIQAFVDGINAYVERTRTQPQLLSREFRLLGIKPGLWTPAVVVSRFNGLLGNIGEEMNIALAVHAIGAEKVKDILSFQPADPDLRLDPAIDSALLSPDILRLYFAFRGPIHFTANELAAGFRGNHSAAAALNAAALPTAADLSRETTENGSNNWVVSGSRTPTGYPLMANDPHRAQSAPSLRYWVHLVAPGWDVIGAGEPALPGVSIGHNNHGAWGLTIFSVDMEDLYVYDTNPGNPLQYRYNGRWESMQVIRETIPVKGSAPVPVELKYTRHGPVVYEDRAHHKAYAVRAAWLATGGAPYLASLRMDQAQTWEQFRDACSYSHTPAENMVWADRDGNIGYQAVGAAPNRPNWSGLVPVPGDGRYEWNGFLPVKALPHVLNPDKGYWNTSNNYMIPRGWPYPQALSYQWADPFRSEEVAGVLGSGREFTVADMVGLQNYLLSIPAHSLVPLLRDLPIDDRVSARAAQQLLHWNDILDKDSVAAGIYEMWQRHLMLNMHTLLVPQAASDYIGTVSLSKTIDLLEAPDGRFGNDPTAGRDEFLTTALHEAVAELHQRLGGDMSKWTLGAYHHAKILHPLDPALTPRQQALFDVGDLPRGGDGYTIDATGSADNQTSGGSFKIVADTGNWDNSVGINNPGQSGNVDSPHYRDLYPLWARGKYFPIFFSDAKVRSVAESSVELQPAR